MNPLSANSVDTVLGDTKLESPFTDQLVQFSQSISWDEFNTIRRFAHQKAGISIADYKQNMVFGRVIKRLRHLGITTIAEYLEFLDGPAGIEETEHLVNALTTNKTSFFREDHHFDHLARSFLPEKYSSLEKVSRRRFRMWSAGCSSGEEAYSIAMTALETAADCRFNLQSTDFRILATDIDTAILEKARAGIYPVEFIRDIPLQLREKYIQQGERRPDYFSVKDTVRNLISFKRLNLISAWPMKGPFDAIFCRNVVIYFDKDTQRMLFDRFAELLRPGGLLYIGHSESLHRVCDRFEIVGQSIYRRII